MRDFCAPGAFSHLIDADVKKFLEAQKTYKEPDKINPSHYKAHPSGVECIQITEHMGFNLGNAMKYIWRADFKGCPVDDLKKAKWYLEREIENRSPKDD